MDNSILVHVVGDPVPKARARTGRGGGKTPARTKAYEQLIAWHARTIMGARLPLEEPLEAHIEVWIRPPKKFTGDDYRLAMDGKIVPAGVPDLDNYVKTALDACNKILYADDGQIVRLQARKSYASIGALLIEVAPVEL